MVDPLMTLAIVVIGRNEGERLKRCLRSALVVDPTPLVVYVDSGSTDGSCAWAQEQGVHVVQLDTAIPFTAARARNAGFRLALETAPRIRYVQFIDGDCEFADGWLATACEFLDANPKSVAVCGRRRERHPDHSLYNRLCDMEWDTPVGPAQAFGGDVLLRVDALRAVDGYRDDLIAGEEPELALRLRRLGGEVHRIDTEMTLHDVAMARFSQWWRRSVRAGHAFGEGAALHGRGPERHWVREARRSVVWGAGIPLAILLFALALRSPLGLLLLLAYPLQLLRLAVREEGSLAWRLQKGLFLVLGKFAEAQGIGQYVWRRLWHKRYTLIEYK